MSEREHSNTLKYSKLFVENQQIMEHSKILMVPENIGSKMSGEALLKSNPPMIPLPQFHSSSLRVHF